MIMDQWEITTAEIEYGVDILHVMETTKFLSASQLSWDANQWPVWANADYVWKRVAFSSEREHGHASKKGGHFSPVVTSAYSMNRLMLFSENRQVSVLNNPKIIFACLPGISMIKILGLRTLYGWTC